MPRLYLHIGRGKTGTTVIQSYLSANRDRLAAQGVHYVLADDNGKGLGHQQIAKSFISNAPPIMHPARDPVGIRRKIAEEIEACTAETVLLSSENFAIADVGPVIDYFGGLRRGYDIRIIFFARSQDELAESEFNQVVKIGRESGTIHNYIANEIDGCDFMTVARAWEGGVGRENMICRLYDAANRDVIENFLSCILEIDSRALGDPRAKVQSFNQNRALGIRALAAARLLNQTEVSSRMQTYRSLFEVLRQGDLPALLLDSEQARRYRNSFADSNFAFTERYLNEGRRDLGGRRYSDADRDAIRAEIVRLGLDIV